MVEYYSVRLSPVPLAHGETENRAQEPLTVIRRKVGSSNILQGGYRTPLVNPCLHEAGRWKGGKQNPPGKGGSKPPEI